MSPTPNSLVTEQQRGGLIRPARESSPSRSALLPHRDSAFSRWVSMSHAALNQAKLAAPRSASGSPAPCRP